jgi:outer membrane protein assembly factor BamB
LSEEERNVIYRLPTASPHEGGRGNWLGAASLARLGPNRHHRAGDERFAPDNYLLAFHNANFLAIVSRATGEVVWRLGPDYAGAPSGWLVGLSHAYLIPEPLVGAGNLLVFEGGGNAGYGPAAGVAARGTGVHRRDNARVAEIDPVTGKVLWEYTPQSAGHINPLDNYKFFSPLAGHAQRLPNGNTLITEGANGRLFEVTDEGRVVWEYVNPYVAEDGRGLKHTEVPRAYRLPYDWLPQLPEPEVVAVAAPDVTTLRVPGAPSAAAAADQGVTPVDGVAPSRDRVIGDPLRHEAAPAQGVSNFCVISTGDE